MQLSSTSSRETASTSCLNSRPRLYNTQPLPPLTVDVLGPRDDASHSRDARRRGKLKVLTRTRAREITARKPRVNDITIDSSIV